MSELSSGPKLRADAGGRHGLPAQASGGGVAEVRRRRAKYRAREALTTAVLGMTAGASGNPGLLMRTLANLARLVEAQPDNAELNLDVADRCIKALPYILEKEGDSGLDLAKALSGHAGPVQIVFGQHFHARSSLDQGQAGQALPGQAEAGSKPDQPA